MDAAQVARRVRGHLAGSADSVRPVAALVRRELVRTLRSWRLAAFAAVLAAVCALTVVEYHPAGSSVSLTNLSFYAQGLFATLSVMLICGVALFIPAVAGTAIVSEREMDTYDLLVLTLIRPSGLVIGKLINAIGVYALVCIAIVPVAACVFFQVGVDWLGVALVAGLIGATALSCGAVGVLASVVFRRTVRALVAAYLGMMVIMGLPAAVAFVFFNLTNNWPASNMSEEALMITSPLATAGGVILGTLGWSEYVWALQYHVGLCVGCVAVASLWLHRRRGDRTIPSFRAVDNPAQLRARRLHFPFYLIDPRRRAPVIQDSQNPLFIREFRWGWLGRAGAMVRVFYVVFGLHLALFAVMTGMLVGGTYEPEIMLVPVSLIILFTVGVIPLCAAALFPREFEQDGMDMLRMTLLCPQEIVHGKLGAAVIGVLPLLAAALASLPLWLVSIAWHSEPQYEGESMQILLCGYGTLAVSATLAILISFLVSLWARRTYVAVVWAYVAILALFGGVSLALALLFETTGIPPRQPGEAMAAFPSPFVAYIFSMTASAAPDIAFWALNAATHTGLAVVLLAAAVWRYKRGLARDA